MGELSDSELVRRVLAGRREDFAQLIERHRTRVFSVILNSVGDREMAEDLTQETFLKAYRNLGSYDPSLARFSTWITTIATRLCIDTLRRRRPEDSLDMLREEKGFDPESQVRTDRPLDQETTGDAVRRAIQKLPEKQRLAVTLKHIEGLPFTEVAQIMGCTVNAAKVHAHRGRNRLAELLGHIREEGLA